jgi:hypothetical protein
MNVQIPLTSPQILTVSMFQNHGFFTGTATSFQIQTAFAIAENQVARDIGTFLAPTTFTGSYPFVGYDRELQSPVGKVVSINGVQYFEKYSNGVEQVYSGTAVLTDPDNGYFYSRVSPLDNSSCNDCSGGSAGIYRFDVSITAGYSTGITLTNPICTLALCMAADIALKIMVDEGIGVVYENMTRTLQVGRVIQTFETRGFLGNTIYGPSSRGQFIYNLLEPFRIRRAGRLGY